MAYSLQNNDDLTALGNAIRAKTGNSNNMSISQMTTAVAGISGGASIKFVQWDTNSEANGTGAYANTYKRDLASNTTYSFTTTALPSHFYFYYVRSAATGSTYNGNTAAAVYEYNNGTLTSIGNHSMYELSSETAIITPTVTRSGSTTTIKLKTKKNFSGSLFGGKNNPPYLTAIYVG